MAAYNADYMGWDFNGPLARGYPEITTAYRMLSRSALRGRPLRFARLFFRAQPRSWRLVMKDRQHELAEIFSRDVLEGEDYGFISDYMENHPIEDTHANRLLRRMGRIGKKLDARIDEDAGDVVRELYDGGTENFVYSSSFVPIIEGSLRRNNLREYFTDVVANDIRHNGRGKVYDYARNEDGSFRPGAFKVNPLDKSETFRKSLGKMNMPLTGERTAYIGDAEPDRRILTAPMVEFPFIAPNASKEFKERCRDENRDAVILESIRDLPRHLRNERKLFSYAGQ